MDVWQTRMPWPATLAMAGSEQQDAVPVRPDVAERPAAADLLGGRRRPQKGGLGVHHEEGGNEQVRTTLMNHFGSFETEFSHLASEYLSYSGRP